MARKPTYEELEQRIKILEEESVKGRRAEETTQRERQRLYEVLVGERTAELAQSNAKLRTEIEDRRKVEEALRQAHEHAAWLARFPEVLLTLNPSRGKVQLSARLGPFAIRVD
jgi:phosphoglycerate-specific signal transduction histidine kinase